MLFSNKNLAVLAATASLATALPAKVSKRGFNAGGSNNVAVWWGNSPETNTYGLDKVCADSSTDIVILTFATSISGSTVTVGGGADSTTLGSTIKQCQSSGKKVFMSVGGATGTIQWSDDSAAKSGADAVYNEFLTSSGKYGVALDGIDLDIENNDSKGWAAFATELRSKMNSNQYLSGAPQCPSPDASLPFATLNELDFVWVQFYNNGPCNHGASGFDASVKDWSSKLTKPKLYIGAPGSSASAGSGYIEPAAMQKEVADVLAMGLKNFGGYALWDGSTAMANNNYQAVIKKALGGGSSGSSPSSGSGSESTSSVPTATGAPVQTGATTAAPAGTTTATAKGKGAVTSSAFHVKATSTAHVTKTKEIPTGTGVPVGTGAPTATPIATDAPFPPSNSTGSANGQSCSDAGKIVCSSDGSQFGICDGTQATMMAVSEGTVCQGGSIVAADSGATDASGVSGAASIPSATGSAAPAATSTDDGDDNEDNDDSE